MQTTYQNQMAEKRFDHLVKILLIGNSDVGKDQFLSRFVSDTHVPRLSTIGVDFRIKDLEVDGLIIKLQIWDTAGQERLKTSTGSYLRGAHGVIFVYDITSYESFIDLKNWVEEAKMNYSSTKKLLLGHRCEKAELRQVDAEKALKYARENEMDFLEASSVNNVNIENAFTIITKNILESRTQSHKEQQHSTHGEQQQKKQECIIM